VRAHKVSASAGDCASQAAMVAPIAPGPINAIVVLGSAMTAA